VIIGNPPYNVGQVNENDNNKNRTYEVIDKRLAETYSHDSKATSKSKLNDPTLNFSDGPVTVYRDAMVLFAM